MKPSEVVTAAYMAANEEKYAEAEKYLSSEAKAAIQEATEFAGGVKDVWDTKTRNATIDGIEITQQDVRGEKSTIALLIHFKDGSISNHHESLIKESGQWKMTL
jgi:D-aminopeptidase